MGIKEDAYRYAVKNAFLHGGKAEAGAVVGKIIALHKSEQGFDIKKAMPEIQEAVKRANALKKGELEKEFSRFEEEGYELKPKPKREGLPSIEFAERGGKIVTRYAPNPSGAMHFGHARQAILNHDIARKYNGKFILRFEDTDPKTKVPLEDGERMFIEDLAWLGIKADETFTDSGRFSIYYEHMKKTIGLEKAYVCLCDNDEWKKKKAKGIACACRDFDKKKNLELFNKMLKHELKEGQAVLRIKTDIQHPDPSVRDWWAAKIVDKPNHPKLKNERVFPSYNFAAAIDDHLMGITLIIRGQEHAQNSTKQKFLYDYFGWEYPEAIHTGRVKSNIGVLSKSKINALMKTKGFLGFDDPRLGTIRALRRRGFEAEAIREIMIDIGLKTSDTTVQFDRLAGANRKLIDSQSERIVFIDDPVRLSVRFAAGFTAKLPRHPDLPEKGTKNYELKEGLQRFIVSKKQLEKISAGDIVRLKQAYNIKIASKNELEIEADYFNEAALKNAPIIHWLLEGQTTDVEVILPKGDELERLLGLAEKELEKQKPGVHIQLERFGYARVDRVEKGKVTVWFTHD